ncbi:MAG: MerR family transcriptional regulator [Chloroflexi bacterium]|nr:MerR family transcriptional regulator [Chloroflexota bacterium]
MTLLRIGDFSQLAQVSTRALRLYDELNLLKPAHVEHFTSYRFYSLDQLPRLNRILALKDLGFSLEQIATMLTDDLTAQQLSDMLAMKQIELEKQLEDGRMQIARVTARQRQIEAEGKISPYEILVKEIPPLAIASVRRIVPTLNDADKVRTDMLHALYQGLSEQRIQPESPELAIYHNREYVEEEIDVELATAVSPKMTRRFSPNREPASHTLAFSPLMATTIHHGHFANVGQAITALCTWAAQNEYAPAGAYREIHLFGRELDLANFENVTVEIQLPIEKK